VVRLEIMAIDGNIESKLKRVVDFERLVLPVRI